MEYKYEEKYRVSELINLRAETTGSSGDPHLPGVCGCAVHIGCTLPVRFLFGAAWIRPAARIIL
jgi:hypothetical protein